MLDKPRVSKIGYVMKQALHKNELPKYVKLCYLCFHSLEHNIRFIQKT